MATRAQNINPSILTWARETTSLSLEEAARKLGLSSSERSSASEKLKAFEAGDAKPTRNQLFKFSTIYRQPLTIFYRNEPPRIADRGVDFRTLQEQISAQENALLDVLLRDVQVQQDLVRAILEDDEDARPLGFVNSIQIKENPSAAASQIKKSLKIKHDNWTTRCGTPDKLFSNLRERVEDLGVFVLLIGNLGSHHSNISEKVFRGFAIADDFAPFIVINDQDAQTARSFTLAHELVHLFVGATGVSTSPSTNIPSTARALTERFCNDVAGELLLPAALISGTATLASVDQASDAVSKLAGSHNLSELMVAYRLQRLGRIDKAIYAALSESYTARWHKQKQRVREKAREAGKKGPSYYKVRKHRLGNALLNLVGRTLRENQLTHTTAARMLGVKPSSVEPLLYFVNSVNGSYQPEAGGL